MRNHLIIFGLFFLLSSPVSAEDSVDTSTAIAKLKTVEDIYPGARYRDPFTETSAKSGGISGSAVAEWDPEDFSIHELELKGIMRDKSGSFAVLKDRVVGMGFVLRQGRLYDLKNKPVPDVTGKINLAQKTVYLITSEKDVQTLRLGEDKEEMDE